MEIKDLIQRRFTKELTLNDEMCVYDLFKWKKVDILIKNYSTDETICDIKDAEFPEHFSQTACNIIASNYFRKNVPSLPHGQETSYRQVVSRMVDFWVLALIDERIITQDDSEILFDELAYMMCSQMFAPNSPQWFNTGLNTSYLIKGEGRGHYYYDEEQGKVVESQDSYTRTQGSACFILGIQDALLGDHSITDNLTTETRLFKYGSGVGSNFSRIRGVGEPLAGGGKSSGLMSFLKVFDANAGAIKSGGTTRRAAKMNILDVDHPEVEDFISWKSKEEQKVRDLGKMGYDTSITGEAYATVSGQNANNSVRFTDDFMKAVKEDKYWNLISRTGRKVVKTVKARDLWKQVAKCAWDCGDPGVQFHNTINRWNTCRRNEYGEDEAIVSSNPCSEYMFLNDTACNLASLNLMAFVEDGKFNLENYTYCISLVHLVLEATIHWGQFPTENIAKRSYLYRTTGMGYTNLGGLLMSMGIAYDSELGRDLGAYLMSIMTAQCYLTSSLIAKEVGPFAVYDSNKETILEVIRKHGNYALNASDDRIEYDLSPELFIEDYRPLDAIVGRHDELPGKGAYSYIETLWNSVESSVKENGIRNAQVTVLAPTGTIAFAMDCATTSSEPFFNHIVWKTVVDGSTIKMMNPIVEKALEVLGYTGGQIANIKKYLEEKNTLYGAPHLKHEHYSVFAVANESHPELTVSPEGHLLMMSKLTQQVSGAISKTVNLPSTATVEDVEKVFMRAWELEIKAITVYRDGCKASQPLNLEQNKKSEDMTYAELLERVKELEAKVESTSNKAEVTHEECVPTRHKPLGIRSSNTHEMVIEDLRMYVTVAKDGNGSIREVFINAGKQGDMQRGLLETISRLISIGLQYNIPIDEIRKILRHQKFQPLGFVGGHPNIKRVDSISDAISKILDIECGDYSYCQVKPNTTTTTITLESTLLKPEKDVDVEGKRVYGKKCNSCGSTNMRQAGTCYYCEECGSSTGGCS